MATTAAIPGMSTTLKIGATDVLLGLRSISGFGGDREAIDVTTTSSASNSKEYLPGLIDNGSFTCDVNYDPNSDTGSNVFGHDSTAGLAKLLTTSVSTIADVVKAMTITFFDGSAATFDGFVKSMKVNAATEGRLVLTLVIQVTGPITWPS